ncbi:MAG: cysteine desulfurase [Gammaproteobacteria bacterium]|nr:cysteine desulfurase [Gammaproteobacteria bacterium]
MKSEFVPPRRDFPLIVNREPIAYLDNAATTQKPQIVLDCLLDYYGSSNSNVHRSAHTLGGEATAKFEDARQSVASFIGARRTEEVIWTRGTTESINLVANTYGTMVLEQNSCVVVSQMEHHSNIVPWQMACEKAGAKILAIRVNLDGTLDLDHYRELLRQDVRIVAVGHISNALGTINPVQEMIGMAHDAGAKILIDGAQAAPHLELDVSDLNCDFYAFSGHKIYGPTGIGVLYGRKDLLEAMPPWQGGGEMIENVTMDRTTYQEPPYKFEAGTPDVSGPIALKAALEYYSHCVQSGLHEYEQDLLRYATSSLRQVEGLRIVGEAPNKCPIVSFLIEGTHPNDVATLLDEQDVAVRSGHHCAMPLMNVLGIPGTIRASFGLYNSKDEIDRLIKAVQTAAQILKQ